MMMKSLPICLLGALLLVQAAIAQTPGSATGVSISGFLHNKFPCTQPDPPVATFAWAPIGAANFQRFNAVPSCTNACSGFHLAPSVNPTTPATTFLCRFAYTSQAGVTSVVYGVEQTASDTLLGLTLTTSECVAKTVDGNQVASALDGAYECGCCGTINQEGKRYSTGCNLVTNFVPSATACPATTAWTNAGTQICTANTATGTAVFGTINTATNTCATPDGVTVAATFQKLCYKINPYAGPPAPDCKKKNTGK